MPTNKPTRLVRLNKYIADAGVTSRRKADELIQSGEVKVNGRTVAQLGARIDPQNDSVKVQGRLIRSESQRLYMMFNKPKGVLTSMSDPEGRPTVGDYVERLPVRVFPVGRLDWDTEGLLLLTNDGDFANEVMHPKGEVPKTYLAKVDGQIPQTKLDRLLRGVTIIGGRVKALHVEKIKRGAGENDWVKIVVSEGKNRQVRRMFEKIGYDVKKLQRVAIGQLRIGSLKKGQLKPLTANQIDKIFKPKPETQKLKRRKRQKSVKR